MKNIDIKERNVLLKSTIVKREENYNNNLNNINSSNLHKGDLVFITLPRTTGSVQYGNRIAVIISNEKNNLYSPNVNVLCLTSKMSKKPLPTHVLLKKNNVNKLKIDSIVLSEQIFTISKKDIQFKTGSLNNEEISKVEKALLIQLGL